jgi:tyrosine-protein kinase Etk/Wzc
VPIEAPQPALQAPQSTAGSLPVLVQVALRRRRLIWIASLAVLAAGGLTALVMPSRYTATVVMMPPQQSGSSSASMLAQLGNMGALASMGGGLSIKNPNDLQVALLKSQTVEDAMVARFHLKDLYHTRYLSSTRKRWERKTVVDNGLRDGLIRLSVTDSDAHRAAALANGWVEEYRRMTASLAVTEASQRRLFFERELAGAHEELTRAEENLKQTEQRTGVVEIDSQSRAMIAGAAALRAQVAAKQVEIRAMREFAAGENPDLVRAEQELSGMEGQLAQMDAGSSRSDGDLAMPRGKITQAGLDYVRALREMKYREAIYDLMTRQYEVATVDEARQGALVQIVDPAMPPDKPTSLYKVWIVAGATLGALPLAFLLACVVEVTAVLRRYRLRSASWTVALEAVFATVYAGGAK